MYMKRLSCFFILCLFASVQMTFAFELNGVYYNVDADKTNELKVIASPSMSYSGTVDIPTKVTRGGATYTVTSIAEEAFARCKNLTKVRIPASVVELGENAFAFSGVREVEFLGDGLAEIPYGCFMKCQRLRTINLPKSLKHIKRKAFQDCPMLSTIDIPSSVIEIQGGAFGTVEEPKDVWWGILIHIEAGNTPLRLYTKMGSISFPCSSLSIDREINCYPYSPFGWKLKQINIGQSVTKLTDELLFEGCTEIERITIYALNIPLITAKTFASVNKQKCVLCVPKGMKEKYATAKYWSEFQNIIEN